MSNVGSRINGPITFSAPGTQTHALAGRVTGAQIHVKAAELVMGDLDKLDPFDPETASQKITELERLLKELNSDIDFLTPYPELTHVANQFTEDRIKIQEKTQAVKQVIEALKANHVGVQHVHIRNLPPQTPLVPAPSQAASAAHPIPPVTLVSKKVDPTEIISERLKSVALGLLLGKRGAAFYLVEQLHQSSVPEEKESAGYIFGYLYHHMTIEGKRKMEHLEYGAKTFFGKDGFNEANDQDRVIAVKRTHVRFLLDTAIVKLEDGKAEEATMQFVRLETLATSSGDYQLITRLFDHMRVAKGSPKYASDSFGSDHLYSAATPASEKLQAIRAYLEELAQKWEKR